MKRAKSQSVINRNLALLDQIREIKTDHPLWGYRRVRSYLKYRQGVTVNKKRVQRLMKEQNLIVTPDVRLKAKRGPIRPKPHAEYPNHFWGDRYDQDQNGILGMAVFNRRPRLVHQGDHRLPLRAAIKDRRLAQSLKQSR